MADESRRNDFQLSLSDIYRLVLLFPADRPRTYSGFPYCARPVVRGHKLGVQHALTDYASIPGSAEPAGAIWFIVALRGHSLFPQLFDWQMLMLPENL